MVISVVLALEYATIQCDVTNSVNGFCLLSMNTSAQIISVIGGRASGVSLMWIIAYLHSGACAKQLFSCQFSLVLLHSFHLFLSTCSLVCTNVCKWRFHDGR